MENYHGFHKKKRISNMLHALWMIPAFLTGWVVCYIQMTYGVDQNGRWVADEDDSE
jgi:hypothetical protein